MELERHPAGHPVVTSKVSKMSLLTIAALNAVVINKNYSVPMALIRDFLYPIIPQQSSKHNTKVDGIKTRL